MKLTNEQRSLLRPRGSDTWSTLEASRLVTYLDNATVTNACAILSDPRTFNIYRLIDLESFCEAFLFFDCVRTIIGRSYAWALRSDLIGIVPGVPLYRTLIEKDLLHPVETGGSFVHGWVEGDRELDEIAKSLNITESVSLVEKMFGDSLPWTYDQSDRNGVFNLIWGTPAYISDSYPQYFFPKPGSQSKAVIDDGEAEPAIRLTGWKHTFISQTLLYIAQASFNKMPYICSSVRMPVVEDILGQLNRNFVSTIHGCLRVATSATRDKVDRIIDFFGNQAIGFPVLPALFCVLREARRREDILPSLLRLREREDIVKFRTWNQNSRQALLKQDLTALQHCLKELTALSEEISSSFEVEPFDGSMTHIPDFRSLTSAGKLRIESSEQNLIASCYSPGLAFLKDIGAYIEACAENTSLIGSILEHDISIEDIALLKILQGRREQLFSKGSLPKNKPGYNVRKMEIHVGDTFNNIHNSVIAARGALAKGVITLEQQGKSDISSAIRRLDSLISMVHENALPASKRSECVGLLSGIADESAKPHPNQTVLAALGTSLTTILGFAAPLAEAAKALLSLIRG